MFQPFRNILLKISQYYVERIIILSTFPRFTCSIKFLTDILSCIRDAHFPIFPVSVYWSRVRIMIIMHVLPIHFHPVTHIGEDTRHGSMWRLENNIGSDLRATLSLILPCPEMRRPCRLP